MFNMNIPTLTEVAILYYFTKKERGRAADIAKAIGLNEKTVWHALQNLLREGLVEKDEFNIYSITEAGRRVLQEIEENEKIKRRILLTRLIRLVDRMNKSHEKVLEELIKNLEVPQVILHEAKEGLYEQRK